MNIKKIKVGFYLNNKRYPNVDLSLPEEGNPGIGGTEFTTISTAYYLNKLFSETVDILLLADSPHLLPSSLNVCQVVDCVDAAVKSKKEKCDIFIFRSGLGRKNNKIYEILCELNIKAIARSNNTPNIEELNQIANCSQVKCHVCTGQEQLDHLRDHRIFEKSIRIFDLFNVKSFVPKKQIVKRGNTVVFLGNIAPVKGFHHLARVWPRILKEIPEAKLIVIGSGKLYERNTNLGKWGVAEESYESNYIRPFLSDQNGNVIKSVHFAGLLGKEKIEILQNADVGVVNPSGRSEVCPASALEIQACGTPVVSKAEWGLLDTVAHGKTGLLGKGDRDLFRHIVYLLKNPTLAKQLGENGIIFVQNKFEHQFITKQWVELFIDICNEIPLQPQPMKQNYLYKAKFFKEFIRIARKNIPVI